MNKKERKELVEITVALEEWMIEKHWGELVPNFVERYRRVLKTLVGNKATSEAKQE